MLSGRAFSNQVVGNWKPRMHSRKSSYQGIHHQEEENQKQKGINHVLVEHERIKSI